MWRQYEKDIKALPAVARLSEKQAPSSLPAIANIAYHDNNKVRDLEGRMKLSEQSNRVLLEELMKLQQDLKVALRQNEEMVLKERQERLAIMDRVDAAENMYAKVSMQLLRTEEKINLEHNTLASLLNQSKEVERALAGEEQRSLLKGEQIDRYITRFRNDVSELRQMNEQIHSNMRLVAEDVKTLKHRFEIQNSELAGVTQDMKQKIKRVENDNMAAMENILRKQENRDSLEASASHLKQNVDLRLSELQDAINEIRRKADIEASERRAADQQAQLNVEKVQVTLRELETKYQEVEHTTKYNMKEKTSDFETEKNKLVYKMAEMSEEQNKRILQREMQLREDAQMKFTVLEKKLQEEQVSRLTFEKSVRYEMEHILESLKLRLSEELQNMKESAKLTQVHGSQSLVKLSECVTLLEGEIEAGKKAFEEVLHAEIVARQTQNEKTMNQCKELGEKLSLAVATLQQAIAGVTTQTQDAVDQVKKEIFFLLDQSSDTGVSGLADIDSRLVSLSKHMSEVEETLQGRLGETLDYGEVDRLRKKVDRANKWQEGTEKALKQLSMKIQPLNREILNIKRTVEDLQEDMEVERMSRAGRLEAEEEDQSNSMHDPNLQSKFQRMEDELVQMSSQLEKLEHTVNTLRTVLSQKITSEAKTVEHFREVFSADIQKLVNYFVREQRRVFVKHREMDGEIYRRDVEQDGAKGAHSLHLALLSINRWGVYEAYRMLKLKAAWRNVVGKKIRKTSDPSDNYINYEKEDEKESESEEELDEKSEKTESEMDESEEESEESDEGEEEEETEDEDEDRGEESEEGQTEKESGKESEKEGIEQEESEKEDAKKEDRNAKKSRDEKSVKEEKKRPSKNNSEGNGSGSGKSSPNKEKK